MQDIRQCSTTINLNFNQLCQNTKEPQTCHKTVISWHVVNI